MSGGQLFFSDNAIRTSVLGNSCSLNCHIWDLVQLNILCLFHVLNTPAHLSSHNNYDPVLIDSFYPVSQFEPPRLPTLLFCSAICTHWKSKPSLPIHHFMSCSSLCFLFFFLYSCLKVEGSVNSLQQWIQQFGNRIMAILVCYYGLWQFHLGNLCKNCS